MKITPLLWGRRGPWRYRSAPLEDKRGKSRASAAHGGQNCKWQQLSFGAPAAGRARSPRRWEGPWRWPRPVAKRGAPAVQPGQAGGLLPPGRWPASLPRRVPEVAPPPPARPPCPRLPPPRAATGASRSRKLAPLLSSPGRVQPHCARRAIPGPGLRPHEDSDPRRSTCFSARFLPPCHPR